jgi:shikimate kinase/3-dehydroquinate synthase
MYARNSMSAYRRIVLVGFSGSGKSSVAQLLAERLNWSAKDIDISLESHFGKSIPRVFREDGESRFREVERALLVDAIAEDHVVIATGGGAVASEDMWSTDLLRRPGTLVVALDASPHVILDRLTRQVVAEGEAVERPLLASDDPRARIKSLKAERQASYDRADLTLHVDNMSLEDVVGELFSIGSAKQARPTVTLLTPSGESGIYIAPEASNRLGVLMEGHWPKARHVWVVTETNVALHHLAPVLESIRAAGFPTSSYEVPPGESSKSLPTAGELYDWLLGNGIERGDVVVALGGGVIGDLAGLVAATVLRGVGLVQVPTSLLAMVDSSVGGKTGINHPTGKNLIGAFYQPPLVVIDTCFLQTLPPRELTSGWSEVIKHGVIQESTPGGEWNDLTAMLDRNADNLTSLREPAVSYIIKRNVTLKARVVEADERESGIRAYLNFGHTLGHAIEAAGYRYLHGEAIAVGMRAAAQIGVEIGTFDEASLHRLADQLNRYGLPKCAEVNRSLVLSLISSDKKRSGGSQRWVLPRSSGGVELRVDVPQDVVERALASVTVDPQAGET